MPCLTICLHAPSYSLPAGGTGGSSQEVEAINSLPAPHKLLMIILGKLLGELT
jgi:hypothetical protein